MFFVFSHVIESESRSVRSVSICRRSRISSRTSRLLARSSSQLSTSSCRWVDLHGRKHARVSENSSLATRPLSATTRICSNELSCRSPMLKCTCLPLSETTLTFTRRDRTQPTLESCLEVLFYFCLFLFSILI